MRSLRVAPAGALVLSVCAALAGCRKAPPDEIVYRGGAARAPAPTGTVVTPPAPVDPGPGKPFTKAGLLGAVADCAQGRFRGFEAQARVLRDATRAYRDAPTVANRDAARAAWSSAAASWQEAELFRLGPAASPPAPGAKSLREEIYAWPLVSRCRVDEQTISQVYLGPQFATTLVNGRGLFAAEYTLFYEGADNGCSALSPINAQGAWQATGAEELSRRKAAYAAAVAEDVLGRAGALAQAWDPARGNFHGELTKAGAGSATYPTQRAALNAVLEGLFYLDNEVKDSKLGKPLGYLDCGSGACPEAVEAPYSRASTANLRANLAAFRRVFQGCGEGYAGLGVDDWLRDAGAGDLADRVLAAVAFAQTKAEALTAPLDETLLRDRARLEEIHAIIRSATTLLKTEVVTVLNLDLPKSSQGDND